MLNFRPVQAEDAAWARPILQSAGSDSCEYSFVNLIMWKNAYTICLCNWNGWLFVRCESEETGHYHYLYPVGGQNEAAAIQALLEDAAANGREPVLYSLTAEDAARLEVLFPGRFIITSDRDESDYIYNTEDLAELAGKKYQKKRNHISHFVQEYPDWQFHELTEEWIEPVMRFNTEWGQLFGNAGSEDLAEEREGIERVLRQYDMFGLQGGLITTGGRIVAYSFGSAINENTFDVHVEKALYDVNGAYTIINREMARHFCLGKYRWMNREDDVGEEGLRRAKEGYRPVRMEEKFVARLARKDNEL